MNERPEKSRFFVIVGFCLILALGLFRRYDSQRETLPEVAGAAVLDEGTAESLTDALKENSGGMIVSINADGVIGSGLIYAANETTVTVVTAAHILYPETAGRGVRQDMAKEDMPRAVQVMFCDGTWVRCTEHWAAEDADIAFLRIALSELDQENEDQYCHAVFDKETYDALKRGDTVLCMGWRAGAELAAYEGSLADHWIYVEDFGQYMIVSDCLVYPGMSGGGLYDGRGYLIGVICGGNEQGELLAVPLHVVWTKYQEMPY